MIGFDLDLSDCDVQTVEAVAAANGMIPPGKYHVRLNGASPLTSKRTGNQGEELEYEIIAGPFTGKTVKDSVWFPAEGDDPDKAKTTKNRLCLVGHRLGLLKPNPKGKGYVGIEGKNGFGDCLGVEVVVEVAHRKYRRDDGGEGMAVNVTFGGVYTLDMKEAKEVTKGKPAAAASKESQAAAPKGKTRVDEL